MAQYLVPRPVRRGYEFGAGIGWAEVRLLGLGLFVGGASAAAVAIVGLPTYITAAAFVLPAGAMAGSVLLEINGQRLHRHLQAAHRWRSGTRRRLFALRYPSEW